MRPVGIGQHPNSKRHTMTHTRHNFAEWTTSDLQRTLEIVTSDLQGHKEAMRTEPDPEQRAAYADSVADYEAGIARIEQIIENRKNG